MPVFNTNIQLHYGDEVDYHLLDRELKKHSFIPEIGLRSGAAASVTYSRGGNIPIQDVIGKVLRAVKKTGKKFSFTVSHNKNP